MDRYIGTKTINANPMTLGEFKENTGLNSNASITNSYSTNSNVNIPKNSTLTKETITNISNNRTNNQGNIIVPVTVDGGLNPKQLGDKISNMAKKEVIEHNRQQLAAIGG